MKKLLCTLLGGILLSVGCYAQNTTVTGNVTDSEGTAWAGGSWSLGFKASPSQPDPSKYTISGSPLSASVTTQKGTLDNSGNILLVTYDSSLITPTGSGWNLTVCPAASSPCWTFSFSTSGASQSITSSFGSNLPPPRFKALNGAYGYNDNEAQLDLSIGNSYWNVTSLSQRCYNGTAWQACSAGASSAAPLEDNLYFSPKCSGQPNCVLIKQDGKKENDCTTNGTTTVTCPSGNFTSADVGKIAWATTRGTNPYIFTDSLCAQTTIASVTNGTTVVLTAACSGSSAGNSVFYWGTDDGPTIANTVLGCNAYHMSTAATMIFSSKATGRNSTCNDFFQPVMGSPGPAWIGDGFGASQVSIEMTPNFDWGSCGTTCFGSSSRTIANILLHASGLKSSANANCANGNGKVVLTANAVSSEIYGVDVAGICPGATGMVGVQMQNTDEMFTAGGVQDVGTIACQATTSAAMAMYANDCHNNDVAGGLGLSVINSAQLSTYSSSPINAVQVSGANTIYSSYGSSYGGLVEVVSGKFQSYSDSFSGTVQVDSGATLATMNSSYHGITNTGTVISQGNNKTNAAMNTNNGGNWLGWDVALGTLQGTLATSSTLGFYGFGQSVAPAGNSTVNASGYVVKQIPISGSAIGMWAKAGTAATTGTNTVTIMKTHNGTTAATSINCSLNSTSFCSSGSGFDIPALGDIYTCQIATGGATPPANVTCGLLIW